MSYVKWQYRSGQTRGGTPGGKTDTKWNAKASNHKNPRQTKQPSWVEGWLNKMNDY